MPRTGRPRSYTEDEVVEAAKELFWTRGYDASSVQDLVRTLGMPRASLYATFGDKRGLFRRAVQLYVDQARAGLLSIGMGETVLPGLREAFVDVISASAGLPARIPRGCLLGNTTVELVPGDEALEHLVADGFAEMESALTTVVARAQANGEIASDVDIAVVGRALLALFEGFQILAKGTPDPAPLLAVLDYTLAAIIPTVDPATSRPGSSSFTPSERTVVTT